MRRHKHNLGHYQLVTGDMGKLYPIGLVEVLPGDSIDHMAAMLIRCSPLSAPVMHQCTVRIHHFYVPLRLIWEEFEEFITGGPDGMDTSTVPKFQTSTTANNLEDYFGLPRVAGIDVSELPIRAFNAVFNEFYRDQDLVTERLEDDLTIPTIAWEKDYFTTCRPWPQKGTEVTLPLGDKAAVHGIGAINQTFASSANVYETGQTGTVNYASATNTGTNPLLVEQDPDNAGFPGIFADLSTATAASVNAVRRAFAIQRYQEARARYGSRYVEYLRYLGIRPSDGRLERPEFLGGGRTNINFSEVLQTGPETGTAPSNELGVGDMYGHGIAAMRSNRYRRYIEEHGYIMSLLSVRPKSIYTNGIHRSWLRTDKEDYWQRELQFIGQQEVFLNEVWADATNGTDTFGYQDRYREYREHPSTVVGEFRNVLNYWHLGRELASAPTLNASFVQCVPSKRIFNEQTMHSLWMMAQHRIVARRMVPRSSAAKIL